MKLNFIVLLSENDRLQTTSKRSLDWAETGMMSSSFIIPYLD